jgi:hypothetical protein
MGAPVWRAWAGRYQKTAAASPMAGSTISTANTSRQLPPRTFIATSGPDAV